MSFDENEKICRICLNSLISDYDCVFNQSQEFETNEYSVDTNIKELSEAGILYSNLFNLKISENDSLPIYICNYCTLQLKLFHKFKTKAIESYKLLNSFKNKNNFYSINIVGDDYEKDDDNEEKEYEYYENNSDKSINNIKNYVIKNQEEIFLQIQQQYQDHHQQQQQNNEIIELSDNKTNNLYVYENTKTEPICNLNETEIIYEIEDFKKEENIKVEFIEESNNEEFEEVQYLDEELHDYMNDEQDDVADCDYNDDNNGNEIDDNNDNDDYNISDNINVKIYKGRKFKIIDIGSTDHVEQMNNESESNDVIETSHTCKNCNQNFKTKNQLYRHRTIQHARAKLSCSQCTKTFHSEETFETHLRIHSGLPAYECPECPKTFNQKAHYVYHMKGHRNERDVQCHLCGKGFRTNSDLRIHLRVHNDERRYECDVCGKKFRAHTHMTNHRYSHFDEKLECELCHQNYSCPNVLRTHIKSVHLGESPYQCENCNRRFKRKHHLKAHYKTHARPGKHNVNNLVLVM